MLTTVVIKASAAAPNYCKVNGTLAPSLNLEIRLPDAWNGKLYYGGGGGYDGSITPLIVPPLIQGYAEVVSDSGHQGDGMSAAFAFSDTYAAQRPWRAKYSVLRPSPMPTSKARPGLRPSSTETSHEFGAVLNAGASTVKKRFQKSLSSSGRRLRIKSMRREISWVSTPSLRRRAW